MKKRKISAFERNAATLAARDMKKALNDIDAENKARKELRSTESEKNAKKKYR